jgi:hypothetical protein
MRKCDVLLQASRYARGPDVDTFLDRAAYFSKASLDWLGRFQSRTLTRPLVLMLSYGYMYETKCRIGLLPAPEYHTVEFADRVRFVPQKQIAIARAKWCCALAVAGLIVGVILTLG